ncbi:MAG: hypothetical protein ABIV94_06870 [Acidimicrobiales bacterium]
MRLMRAGSCLLLGVLLACGCTSSGAGPEAVLSPDAPPTAVVQAYIDAINSDDIATARTFLSPEHAALVDSQQDSWFRNIVSITDVQLTARPAAAPFPANAAYEETASVEAHFVLKQKHVGSMNDGSNYWGSWWVATPAPTGSSSTREWADRPRARTTRR